MKTPKLHKSDQASKLSAVAINVEQPFVHETACLTLEVRLNDKFQFREPLFHHFQYPKGSNPGDVRRARWQARKEVLAIAHARAIRFKQEGSREGAVITVVDKLGNRY